MQKVFLYKIFYDEASRRQIEPEFLPLDNRDGPENWFELWPILRHLEATPLEEDTWYGFFSPKFPAKAHMTLAQVQRLLAANPKADVALFSFNWPSLVRFRNVWMQGDRYHPGLIDCFETFLRTQGHEVKLADLLGDFETSVFSNYVIAKREFWEEWRKLARAYYDYVTAAGPDLPDNVMTEHNGQPNYRLRVFVQERLSSWVLQSHAFRVVHAPYVREVAFGSYLPDKDSRLLRWALGAAEFSKRQARKGGVPGAFFCYRLFKRLADEMRTRLSRT